MTTYLERAYDAAAGEDLRAISRQIDQLAAQDAPAASNGNTTAWAYRRIAEALNAGGTYPDIADEICNQVMAGQVASIEHEARTSLLMDLRLRRTALEEQGADDALLWLNTELGTLLEGVSKTAAHLNGATNAGQAIASGSAQHWNQLTELGTQYTQLRTAQFQITRTKMESSSALIYHVGITRGFTDREYIRATLDWAEAGLAPDLSTWPGDTDDTRSMVPTDSLELYLVWLADRGDAWVPTSQQIVERHDIRQRCIALHIPEGELPEPVVKHLQQTITNGDSPPPGKRSARQRAHARSLGYN